MEATSRALGCSEMERSPHVRSLTPETLDGATSPADGSSDSQRPPCTCHHIYTWGGLRVWTTEWAEGARRACCCPHLTSLKVALCLGPRTDCSQGPHSKDSGFRGGGGSQNPSRLGILEPEGKSPGLCSVSEHPRALEVSSNSQIHSHHHPPRCSPPNAGLWEVSCSFVWVSGPLTLRQAGSA